jgi:hypothetical protein
MTLMLVENAEDLIRKSLIVKAMIYKRGFGNEANVGAL